MLERIPYCVKSCTPDVFTGQDVGPPRAGRPRRGGQASGQAGRHGKAAAEQARPVQAAGSVAWDAAGITAWEAPEAPEVTAGFSRVRRRPSKGGGGSSARPVRKW
ncbi:hypothetical protein GCM10017600_36390 [Streptosporangium carneum]|uniref:Uncharacterized protein n=1 Tax=Streptosporangium carneum TaxID=47481 RepID=A0A9W6I213_9ACTN|nr:hypothetical protein GCM10017600_36390 [Streptosporangium carneum]